VKTWKETAIELHRELDALRQTVARRSERDRLLRAAVKWWPERTHEQSCAIHVWNPCNCGAFLTNEKRRQARELAGVDGW